MTLLNSNSNFKNHLNLEQVICFLSICKMGVLALLPTGQTLKRIKVIVLCSKRHILLE